MEINENQRELTLDYLKQFEGYFKKLVKKKENKENRKLWELKNHASSLIAFFDKLK